MFFLIFIQLVKCGYISTWDFTLDYDIEGKLSLISIPFKLENEIESGYLQLGGADLHQTSLSEVVCIITTLDGTQLMTQSASTTTQPSWTSDYYFLISVSLKADIWYILQIYPTSVSSGFYYEPLILRTISSLDDTAMIYDFNYGAGHLNVDDLPSSGMTVTFNVDETLYSTYTQPGAQYVIIIYIVPRVAISSGAQIELQIVQGSHTDGIDETDFEIISSSCWSTFSVYTCTTTSTTVTLITTDSISANVQFQVQISIENPGFVSSRDLRVVTKSPSQGNRIQEKGQRSNVFLVEEIETQLSGIEYLWGIDYLTDLTDTQIGIFEAQDTTVFNGPYNSIKVSFTVDASVTLLYPLIVKLKLNAEYILSYATKHNFQQYDDENPIYCDFDTDTLICHNVGTLSASTTYYISTKFLVVSPDTDGFCQLDFYLDQSITPNDLRIYALYSGITLSPLQDSHYLDINGWHNPSTGLLGQTQVSSVPESTLSDLGSVFGSSDTIGIVNGDGMILFFLKVSQSEYFGSGTAPTCPTGPTDSYIKMTILMNSQVLQADSNNIPTSLQYVANDGGGVYSDDQFKCVSQGLCDIDDQNTFTVYTSSTYEYGLASFTCGGSCNYVSICNMFMGTQGTATSGSNGVIGIPVSFSSTFVHSSQYADDQLLDFVVTFYSIVSGVQTLISQHLINGYTINTVQDLKVSFINYYMGTTLGNQGDYIPTLFRVTLPSLDSSFDKIQVFFDSNIDLIDSTECQTFEASNGPSEAWMLHQSIICDKSNELLIPVIPNGIVKTVHVALTLTTDGIMSSIPSKVYRVYGLPIKSETRTITAQLFSTQSSDLIYPYIANSQVFDMYIDTTQFQDNKATVNLQITTDSSSSVYLEQNSDTYIGAGLTISCVNLNIFSNAQVSQYFGLLTCTTINYNNVYTLFCPFDSQIHYPLSLTNNIVFLLGKYTQLSSLISYAISNSNGQLIAAIHDPGYINRLLFNCVLGSTSVIHANSLGLQRIVFPIRFSSNIQLGSNYYGSLAIIIELQASITGFNLISSTTSCDIDGLDDVTCTYTSTSTTITVIIISSITQTIASDTVVNLAFKIQSTYGVSFGTNQLFTVYILVPTIRNSITQIYGDTYDSPPVLQEQCSYTQLSLSTTSLGTTFFITNLQLEIPITDAIGILSFDFQMYSSREYLSASSTYIQFNLGFLKDQNMDSNKLKCQIFENDLISTKINSIDTSTMPYIYVYFNQDIESPSDYIFTMKCKNYNTPTSTYSTETFIGKLIDTFGITSLQTSSGISYSSLNLISYTSQGLITLDSKFINSPGFDSVYNFTITNGNLKILLTYLIKLRFHEGISQKEGVSCQMNGTFCYCTQSNGLYTIQACEIVAPLQTVTLTITIPQPNRLLWPTSSNIYICVDNDDDLTNGVYMQNIITDFQLDEYETQSMEVIDTSLTSTYIRTSQTHKISLSMPSGQVNTGNYLIIQFPKFYMDTLSRSTGITCDLTRDDDTTSTNYTSTCTLLSSKYVQMILKQDSSNNLIKQYTLSLGNVPLPEIGLPEDPMNDFRLKVRIISSSDTRVKFASAFYYSDPLSLTKEDKIDLQWSGGAFNYERDETLNFVQDSTLINIYKGTFRTLIRMKSSNETAFSQTFSFQNTELSTFPSSLSAVSGSENFQFLVGTSNTIGYEVFQFTKLTGGTNYVSVMPNLYVEIIDEPCQLTTDQIIYQVVLGGISQPIIIDISNCYPMSDLRINLINENSALDVISTNPQNILYSEVSNYKLYFDYYQYIWQIQNNDTTLNVGDTIQLSFNLSGVSSPYYVAPPNITIKIVDVPIDSPILQLTQTPVSYKNTITFTFNCSNSGTLYWVLGCGDDISYIPLQEIYNHTIYDFHTRTQRNVSDTEWKIYGAQSIDLETNEIFNELRSDASYTLQGYCVDLYDQQSDALVYTWSTSSNGGAGIKLNITFTDSLTLIQQLELVCGLNYMFPIDYNRICNSYGYMCDLNALDEISSDESTSELTGIQSSYYIYIQPDLSLMSETINLNVQNAIDDIESFITLLENYMSIDVDTDPTIVSVSYTEPDQTTLPSINYTSPIVTSSNVTMNFTMSTAQGYLGIGIEQTDTASLPSIKQLRKGLNYLGRELLQSDLIFFNASSTTQNQTQQVWFTDLSANLKYKIYWFYSNDDACQYTLVSNVSYVAVQTSPSQTYSISQILCISFIILFII